MKIGKLQFKQYAADKPITILPGGAFATASDVASKATLGLGSLHSLAAEQKTKLTLARYAMEPDFKFAVVGVGVTTKAEAIEHITKGTPLGQFLVNAEMQYCTELMASLSATKLPAWPSVPKTPGTVVPNWGPVKKCMFMKVANIALFCENTTDSVTTPFANYRLSNVHTVFANRGFAVVSLEGTNDVRANFVAQAQNARTVYLSGIGHGNYTTYTGNAFNPILQVGQYAAAEVKGKGIHFLSCETAGQLGPDTITKGASFYAGYTENFILVWDSPNTPAVDEFKLFAQSDSTFDVMIANGATAQQAYNATVQAFNAAIASVPGTVAATYLTADRDHLKLVGNPGATIQPYRLVRICFPLKPVQADLLAQAGVTME